MLKERERLREEEGREGEEEKGGEREGRRGRGKEEEGRMMILSADEVHK